MSDEATSNRPPSSESGEGRTGSRPIWRLLVSRPCDQGEAEGALKIAAVLLVVGPLAKECVQAIAGTDQDAHILSLFRFLLFVLGTVVLPLLMWWKRSAGVAAMVLVGYGGFLLAAGPWPPFQGWSAMSDLGAFAYFLMASWLSFVALRAVTALRPAPRLRLWPSGSALLLAGAALIVGFYAGGSFAPVKTDQYQPGDAISRDFVVIVATPQDNQGAPVLQAVPWNKLRDFLANHRGATVQLPEQEAEWDVPEQRARVSYRMTMTVSGKAEVSVPWRDDDRSYRSVYEVDGDRITPKTFTDFRSMNRAVVGLSFALIYASAAFIVACLTLRQRT